MPELLENLQEKIAALKNLDKNLSGLFSGDLVSLLSNVGQLKGNVGNFLQTFGVTKPEEKKTEQGQTSLGLLANIDKNIADIRDGLKELGIVQERVQEGVTQPTAEAVQPAKPAPEAKSQTYLGSFKQTFTSLKDTFSKVKDVFAKGKDTLTKVFSKEQNTFLKGQPGEATATAEAAATAGQGQTEQQQQTKNQTFDTSSVFNHLAESTKNLADGSKKAYDNSKQLFDAGKKVFSKSEGGNVTIGEGVPAAETPINLGAAEGAGAETAAAGAGAAEGAGAGAAAAGEGAAAAGGEALASNPVGWAIAALLAIPAAVGLLVYEFGKAAVNIKKWSEQLLESQRYLADFSGEMAVVFANKEVSETFRNMRIGDATAESAGNLSETLQETYDLLEPFTVMVTNFLNNVLAGALSVVNSVLQAILDGVNMIIRGLNKMLDKFGVHLQEIQKNTEKEQLGKTTFDTFIRDFARQGQQFPRQPLAFR